MEGENCGSVLGRFENQGRRRRIARIIRELLPGSREYLKGHGELLMGLGLGLGLGVEAEEEEDGLDFIFGFLIALIALSEEP